MLSHFAILSEALDEALADFAHLYLLCHKSDYEHPETEEQFEADVRHYAEEAKDRYQVRAAMRLQKRKVDGEYIN